ncbi:hypothetical protein ScPMuIL_009728 [Solemya velum]
MKSLALILVAFTLTGAQQCPPKIGQNFVVPYQQRCYEFAVNGRKESWINAQRTCHSRRGDLVVVENAQKQNFLTSVLAEMRITGDTGIWMGINDEVYKGRWTTVTGEPIQYSNWAPDETHLKAFKDCGVLRHDRGGLWEAGICRPILLLSENHGYVCQYELEAFMTTTTPLTTTTRVIPRSTTTNFIPSSTTTGDRPETTTTGVRPETTTTGVRPETTTTGVRPETTTTGVRPDSTTTGVRPETTTTGVRPETTTTGVRPETTTTGVRPETTTTGVRPETTTTGVRPETTTTGVRPETTTTGVRPETTTI